MLNKIGRLLTSPVRGLYTAFDLRDVFFLGGLGMLWYGIELIKGQGWACVVCGPLFMVMGYLMRDK